MRSPLVLLLLAVPAGAAPTPPALRLPDGVRPTRYAAELTVDPTKDRFAGVIDIDLAVARPLELLWLNAADLAIEKASAGAAAATVVPGGRNFVGLAFAKPLPAGAARVHIEYSGVLSNKDSSGAMRQQEGGDWYVFTQFEPIDARRVFPCFDEPTYKVPWKLALRVRAADRAFTNTPQVEEKALDGGWKRVGFAESKPLPSYLIAFAVGPIDIVEAGKSARSGTPVRILVPRGQRERARWAAASTHQILEQLEDYFGSSYPYEKLDCAAVPMFGGAMEHPGLVTFGSSMILQKPDQETLSQKRGYAHIATHELAHQWFGDLVTTGWWDDLWLNEAFASWMTPKILERWQPAWGAAEQRVETRGQASSADSLVSARRIRQPITSNDDMKNAFDGITYSKGATVIGMFERFVGLEQFRRGVQRYMKEHAHGTATATDFLGAISREAGRDIAPAFSTFLDQPGVPAVSFELRCDGRPRLHLSQARYLPKGSTGAGGGGASRWSVPVCARWDGGHACTLLTDAEGDLEMAGAKTCPAWVVANDGGSGYYRVRLAGDLVSRLPATLPAMTAPEKLALLSDLSGMVRAGQLELSALLELAPRLAGDGNRFVVQSVAGTVGWLRDGQLVAEPRWPAYASYIRDLFGARARTLSWKAKAGDDEDTRLLRARLVPLAAGAGEDPLLIGEAKRLATAWLADHHAVEPDVIDAVLSVAAEHGDRALFDRWLSAARAEKDRAERRRLLGGLSSFRDPAIVKDSLPILLTDAFDPREAMTLLWGATRDPRTQRLAWSWLSLNFDALVARLPRDAGAHLPFAVVGLCDESMIPEVRQFFAERARKFEGGPRQLEQALEQMHLCAVYRKDQAPSVDRFLAARK